ncbi:MAG: lecithin retinol acyltransferase family protein [Flavobacteriaceae bacterium]|nr:lecithin retinol acyltransferase family protein [Flavobacteriaceae bacterium]
MVVYSVWIGHGAIAAPGSVISGLATTFAPGGPSSITHWWCQIQTEDPNIWYCAQFQKIDGKNVLCLIRLSSKAEVNKYGETAAGRYGDEPLYTCKASLQPGHKSLKMHQIYSIMAKANDKYSLVSNNCQHFCLYLMKAARYVVFHAKSRKKLK